MPTLSMVSNIKSLAKGGNEFAPLYSIGVVGWGGGLIWQRQKSTVTNFKIYIYACKIQDTAV